MRRFLFCAVVVLAGSLQAALSVRVNVREPAPVDLDISIRRILIVDRTSAGREKAGILESVASLEDRDTDRIGAERCLDGLEEMLKSPEIFEVSRHETRQTGELTGSFMPAPLSWDAVEKLAASRKADAVIVLEYFDSDLKLANPQDLLKQVVLIGQSATFKAGLTVKSGFRLYDLRSRVVRDEQFLERSREMSETGVTPLDAGARMKSRRNTLVAEIGAHLGNQYGARLVPTWKRVTRQMFDKPKNNPLMKRGVRSSQVGDWTAAIAAWEEMARTAKKDAHAGAAAYNVAVSYEVLGDLEQAASWAKRSFVEYGFKKAKPYWDTLAGRVAAERKADGQSQR